MYVNKSYHTVVSSSLQYMYTCSSIVHVNVYMYVVLTVITILVNTAVPTIITLCRTL